MAMPFSQMNPHAHHPGLGPGAMHSNDQDISPAEFFSSGGAQQQMGGGSHGMQNMNTLSTSTSWGGAATQPSETNWFGPGDSAMSLGGRDAMPHTVSAPSLGMLQQQQQPVQSAPTMGGGPMMQNSMSQSQGHMGVSNWQSGNHSTQSAPPGNEGGGGAGGDLEERLKEIMNQSKAAMSTPVNFHTMSAQMSGQASMDSTGGTRDGMEVGPESASRMSAQHYPGNSQPSPIQEEMDDSRVLTVAEHCPAVLMRPHWSVKQFNLQNLLYMGNNSRVLRAVDKHTGITVALKVYNKNKLSDMEKYQVAREIRMHSQLLHENIVRLYCAWKDSQFIHVAEEYAPHGDIYSLLKPRNAMAPVGVAENFVVTKIFRPLLSALSFIHARGLIHRDLKPENILLGEDNNIKLTDFGLSINQELEVANTRLGTLNYIAPEILKCPFKQHPLENKGSDSFGYDNKVDVWSLGVLAYELLTAELPFSGGSMRVTLERIMRNEVLYPSYVSPLARDFMSRCLQSNPRARPSVDELRQHHWICQRYDMEA